MREECERDQYGVRSDASRARVRQLPGPGDGRALESFAKVQAMKENLPDLVAVASHDTTAASKLAAARESAPGTSSDRVAVS